ncbi:MAG: RNase adapter protein RapZ [Pseudomonadota bacterium]|nr:RNase adapter protein RapZ [Pseudomonadota bacterium]
MQLILISGLAGAGKSTALRILEDSGYNCVDNLPPPMLVQLVEMHQTANEAKKIAVSVDTRSYSLLRQLPLAMQNLNQLGIETKIIFLDARTDVLIKRFSETRRKHPLSDDKKTLHDCIIEEQRILSDMSSISHRVDTSDLTANELREIIKQFVQADYSQLNIVIQSFGFKYGLPIDSDFVFDVRCLPNPYYDKNIRDFNGTQTPIIEFLSKQNKVQLMINDIYNLVNNWLAEFSRDNRNYVTISIGCTGGKHRSVYIAEQLHALIITSGYKSIVRHRHINHHQ